MPPHELHPLVPKPQSFLVWCFFNVWCFCFLGTIASVRKLILQGRLLFRNPPPFGVGWNQGWGSISREGEGKERMGRALAEIIISFSPNVCEILRKHKKKIFAAFGCRSYVFPLINSIEPIQFWLLYSSTFYLKINLLKKLGKKIKSTEKRGGR